MGIDEFHTIAGPVRARARAVLRGVRVAPVWARVALARQGRGPILACLPVRGPEQSSLLRIYKLADARVDLGWRAVVIPPTLTLEQRRAVLVQLAPDILLMQGVRHPLNRPALHPGHRIVYDMDDADFHLPHMSGPVAEATPQVDAVIAGSIYVGCRIARPPHAGRPPVVA